MGIFDIFKKSKAKPRGSDALPQGEPGGVDPADKTFAMYEMDRIFKYILEADKTMVSPESIFKTIKSREKEFDGDIPFFKTRKGQKWLEHIADFSILTGAGSGVTRAIAKYMEKYAPTEIKGTIKHY